MNKQFSSRSERLDADSSPGLAAHAPLAVKIRWGRPVAFGLLPRQTPISSHGTRSIALQIRPLGCEASQPAGSSAKLGLLCASFLALTFLPGITSAQSLWKDDVSKPMFADKRATGIGDILTILVQESTSSSKDNKTATAKESGMDANLETFFYSPMASGLLTKGGQMPALKFNSKSDFTGGGTINNSEKLSARAAVQVMDVLPNRNLVIGGRRETSVGGEKQTMVLHGIVRPEDVLANNTIYSYNIADATIQIISKGTISDSQRKGWFHKIWDKVAPF